MVNKERIKQLRNALSQNQIDVANALNLSRETYCMYENGLRDPSCETVVLIAKYYNVSLDYLFGLSEIPISYSDYSKKEKYIIKNLRDASPEVLNALYTITRLNHETRLRSINS